MNDTRTDDSLRQTGRTSRMLDKALSHAGDDGIVFIVGHKEHYAVEFLLPRLGEIAIARGMTGEPKRLARNRLEIKGTVYEFIGKTNIDDATRGFRPLAEYWDHVALGRS